MKKLLTFAFLAVVIALRAVADTPADTRAGAPAGAPVDTRTGIFDPDFRSLTAQIDGDRLAPPILNIDSPNTLTIGFDQLGDERTYLRYTILYCNADWTPSQLTDSEVFDNFNYDEVEQYAFSRATTTHYIHYTITLPNSEYRFRLSGNYLLRVYPEDDPDRTVLQQRFMVTENAVTVGGTVNSRTDVDFNDSHQQLSLTVDTRNTAIRDPNTDLRIVVSQNYRNDDIRTLVHPTRRMSSRLIYEHLPSLIFTAGNEYRRMETVSNLYPGMGTDHIEYHAPNYYHILNTDLPRARRPYRYDQTQHGRYFIREYSSDESDVEADYPLVLFTLDMLALPDEDVYLDGDFMQRRFNSRSRMDYNAELGRYEKLIPLKQGAYNYQYLTLPKGAVTPEGFSTVPASTATVEGNHYETVNEYLVLVYYRAPGDRHDRLLGASVLFSGQ